MKTKPNKPSREVLDHYVYEMGIDGAKEFFKLTDHQFNTILFGTPIGTPKVNKLNIKEYQKLIPSTNPDALELYAVICDEYYNLRKRFVLNTSHVNAKSLTQEDIFHDGLLRILKASDNFKYTSHKETLNLIVKSLKRHKINALKLSNVATKKHHEFRCLFSGLGSSFIDYGILEDERFMNTLTLKQKDIVKMLANGCKQADIAKMTKRDESTIREHIKGIRGKIIAYQMT